MDNYVTISKTEHERLLKQEYRVWKLSDEIVSKNSEISKLESLNEGIKKQYEELGYILKNKKSYEGMEEEIQNLKTHVNLLQKENKQLLINNKIITTNHKKIIKMRNSQITKMVNENENKFRLLSEEIERLKLTIKSIESRKFKILKYKDANTLIEIDVSPIDEYLEKINIVENKLSELKNQLSI